MQNVQKAQLIAEVKTASPFGWRSEKTWDELFKIANRGVHGIMSVEHTGRTTTQNRSLREEVKLSRMQGGTRDEMLGFNRE